MSDKKNLLLLVDAYAMIFRAYYAMIRSPRVTTTGMNTSAVFGFVNIMHELLKKFAPTHVAVCFDPGGKTFRSEQYEPYKQNRDKTPEDILNAVPYIRRILESWNIAAVTAPGFEADDVMGTLSRRAVEQWDMDALLVSGDKDLAQLVRDRVTIYNPGKDERLDVHGVCEKYDISTPIQMIDLLGLMGDTADNIPGCPGVGPKKAVELIKRWKSVEGVVGNANAITGAMGRNVRDNIDQIRLSKQLATIRTDVPIELDIDDMRRRTANLDALRDVFAELEMRLHTQRLVIDGGANDGLLSSPLPPPEGAGGGGSTPKPQQSKRGDAPSAPQPSATQPTIPLQMSLFDATPGDVQSHDEAIPAQRPGQGQALHATGYVLCAISPVTVTDPEQAAAIIARLAGGAAPVAVHVVADGDEAMRATLIGLALAVGNGADAAQYYLPLDGLGLMLGAVAPLFNGTATVVCEDVKWLMVALAAAGHSFTAPYYDTAVAHYLLQPERGHSTQAMAAEMLGIDLLGEDTILGPKGRTRLKWHQVPEDKAADYACRLAAATVLLPDALDKAIDELRMTHLLRDIEQPLVAVLARMEVAGARIDTAALHDYATRLTRRVEQLEQECYDLAGGEPFNTASPAQVGEILFAKLKLDDKAKRTKGGQYSTTEEILSKLRHRHSIVGKILELRGVRKLLNTYVTVLPTLVNPRTGRIHTTFNQTVTATGRLSSTNPNLQNIPVRTDDGREIRRAFIPAEGNTFFSADYSQIELRLVADISGDETMLGAFAAGHDIHAITAARIYHKPLEQVTPDERRKAKTANFGILYGISAFGLAERLDISRAEAKQLIDGYYATFPGVREYIDRSIEQARSQGYVTTLEGRRRMLPDINSRNAVVRGFAERNAINAPIQGTAADVIKRAMIAIDGRMRQEHMRSRMILQVHDELNFDVVPEELDRLADIVLTEMQNAYHGRVTLTASHAAAANWLDAH